MPDRPPCPICLAADAVGWLLTKNGSELQRCAACDHIFVSPQPSDAELARLYSFESGYQRREAVRFTDATRFPSKLRLSLEQLRRHAPAGALLDVGSSSGELLYLARRAGYAAQGVELNPDTAAIARANGLPVFVGTLEQAAHPPQSFDAVHLGDLIEHVRDPAGLLRQLRELVRPGGVLLVVTPNHDALFPRATWLLDRCFGIAWSHPTPPFHLHQFSTRSLARLLERTGFKVVERRYAPCSLAYELRGTGEFAPLKAALRERRPLRAAARAARCAFVAAAYSAVWLADRAAWFKRTDFTMRWVAAAD